MDAHRAILPLTEGTHNVPPRGSPVNTPSSSPSNFSHAFKDIAVGSFAGMISELFEYPFDLAKVRLQSQMLGDASTSMRFKGPLDCLVQTLRNEGIRGLYRGLPVPMVGSMAETAGLFLAYNQIQEVMRRLNNRIQNEPASTTSNDLSVLQLGVSAAGAGFLTSFILTPIELIKCRMQVQMLSTPFANRPPGSRAKIAPLKIPLSPKGMSTVDILPGPLSLIADVVRTSGLRGLWLGQTGTLVRETGGTVVWFGTKEIVAKLLLARRQQIDNLTLHHSSPMTATEYTELQTRLQPSHLHLNPPIESHPSSQSPSRQSSELQMWESALSGALAGAVSVLVLYPIDTVKSAIQTAQSDFGPGFHDKTLPPTLLSAKAAPSAAHTVQTRRLHSMRQLNVLDTEGQGPRSGHSAELLSLKSLGARPVSSLSQSAPPPASSLTFGAAFASIYRTHGIKGLYSGCLMTMLRAIPGSGIVFVIYDLLSR